MQHHGLDFNITRLLAWSEGGEGTFPCLWLYKTPFAGRAGTCATWRRRPTSSSSPPTPDEDLAAWWTQTGLSEHVQAIAGKEMGKKGDHIRMLTTAGGYSADQVIMVGNDGIEERLLLALRRLEVLFSRRRRRP